MGFFQQQLSVSTQLVRSAQQSSNAMYKLRNQASVSVICLAVVISHNLERKLKNKQTKQKTKGERETVLLQMQKDILVEKKNSSCTFGKCKGWNYIIISKLFQNPAALWVRSISLDTVWYDFYILK